MKRLPLLPLRSKALLSACLLVALLPGCKKKEEAPAPPPAPKPAAPKPAPAPQGAPVQKPMSSATTAAANGSLDFKNLRDPFKPAIEAQPATRPVDQAAPPVAKGEQLPIQSYEVNKFKVSGIIVGIKQNRALLVDPQGKPYVVQEGMLVGNREGRITRITADSVEVVERYRDENGRAKKKTIVLTLAKKR